MKTIDIALIVSIVTLATTIVGLIAALYSKLKKAMESLVVVDESGKVKSFKSFEFLKIIIYAVSEAEKTGKKGAEKKEIALTMIQSTLNSLGVQFDMTELSDSIDTLVGMINVFIKKSKRN